ncbi:Zinc finger protein [Pseudolycoriella hygida]|uniref:Zinc finger protein n=1 Tax=Pseudolycoriella hygida TaxID=35572 RepID=A0A9Q0RYT5_9DIPT|nr:Zinc finger protein [Pseudolycoriella hygida]
MESQLQCPVCTLFLHVGMDLQSHLDTHPKDQVIKALVNITMTKQSSDGPSTANNSVHSKFPPIAQSAFTQEVSQVQPETVPRGSQVLFGYSCSTRVFREAPTTTQKSITNARSIVPAVVSARASIRNQQIQKFPITPPPPYGSVLSKLSTTSNKSRLQQIGINSQKNHTLYLPVQNVINEVQSVSEEYVDEYTVRTDQHSEYVENCEEVYLDNDSVNDAAEVSAVNECPIYEDNRLIRTNPVIYINDDEPTYIKNSGRTQRKVTEGLRVLSDVKLPTTVDVLNLDCKFSESFKLEDVLCSRLDAIGEREVSENVDETNLVISDNEEFEMLDTDADVKPIIEMAVKCEFDVEKIVKTDGERHAYENMEETTHGKEILNANRSIIVLPKSPLPTTSYKTLNNPFQSSETSPLRQDPNLTLKSNEPSKTISTTSSNKDSPSKDLSSPQSVDSNKCEIRISNVTSIGKTSVIRLASPKKPSTISETTTTTTMTPTPTARPLLKAPFSKQPKKIVVKFKKPFVPVVEEDANLQPPVKVSTIPEDPLAISIENDTLEQPTANNDEHNDHPLNHPFSPLRQTYTPPPPIYSLISKNREPSECSASSVDLCEKEPILQVNVDDIDDSNESVSVEKPLIERESNDMEIDDSIINSHKCDNEIFTIEFKEDHLKVSNAGVTRDEILQIKIESTQLQVYPKPVRREESILPDCKESIVIPESSTDLSLTSLSQPTTSSQTQNNFNEAGPSRIDYGLSSFEDFYSTVRLSPMNFAPENYAWNQRFSPQYVPFDNDKNSYMDLDVYKNTNYEERAPSTDSLNIRTDEKMPAKGEISEQESNGDVEGSSWSHQMYPLQDTFPRYTSSYDTTVARESWSLSNDQNLPNNLDSPVVLPKFTSLDSTYINTDVKGTSEENTLSAIDRSKQLRTRKKYRCPECPKVFSMLKDKRIHLVADHDYQIPCRNKTKISCTSTSVTPSTSISTVTSSSNSMVEVDFKIKQESPSNRFMPESMNRYLLNYNYNILRGRLSSDIKTEPNASEKSASDENCYQCMVCKEQFFTIKAYDAHMSVHPAECYTCGKFFNHWLNLSIHLKRHLNIRDYWCTYCNKKFVVRQNLLDHMNTHSGEAPLQCKICSKRFRRHSNLIQHRNRHHLKIRPKEKDFICSCGEVFHSEAKIAWHRETHDKKPKCCPYCRERFMHRNSLSRHVRLSHPDKFGLFKENAVECMICNKKYLKSSLKAHMVLHTKKREFECSICNKSFTSKWNLKQHKWIHASRSSKPFKCNLCTKAFIRESEYVSHMNTHKAIKPYTCDHCGCQFARKYNWLRHAREHETPKRYRCDDCGKVFHRAYYLTEHKRSHTGERPFECIICGKTSTTKTNHNKHVKIHHARDPLTAEG